VGYQPTRSLGHYGIVGMRERAGTIGARLSVTRRRKALGTRVSAELNT
jgi:signal transduction histidine kinase